MIKPQSPVDVAVEMLRDLEEFNRSGSKEAFRKQLREEFVRRYVAVTSCAPPQSSWGRHRPLGISSQLPLALGATCRDHGGP